MAPRQPQVHRVSEGHRVVVDGSNLATEGRNLPSLAQLDEAVQSFHAERPGDEIIVVVDASFGYRIDESERKVFEEAEEAGEIVSPPAGAIGRGDGFLLRIADRIDAVVLSNDSFQEFHGEYLWLFDEGRLIGGKPVPGVGWIFTPRSPVRGPKSRVATRDADRARRRSAAPVAPPEPVAEAIAEATAEAIDPDAPTTATRSSSRRRSRPGVGAGAAPAETGPPEAINEPLPFITFIADHPLGTEVEGTVDSFTSHGAFVVAGGARCYAPVSGLGDPPPRSAKEVLKRGDTHTFVIQALDPPRRGIELALPGLAKVAGAPTEETVEAEIDAGTHEPADVADLSPLAPVPTPPEAPGATKPRRSGRTSTKVAATRIDAVPTVSADPGLDPPATPVPAKPRRARKAVAAPVDAALEPPPVAVEPEPAPAKSATRPRKKAAATVPEADGPASEAPMAEGPAEKAPAKRAGTRKIAALASNPLEGTAPPVEPVPTKKATSAKRAATKKATTKKAAPATTKATTATTGSTTKASPTKKATPARRSAKKAAPVDE